MCTVDHSQILLSHSFPGPYRISISSDKPNICLKAIELIISFTDVFNETPPASIHLIKVKEDIWNYELLQVLILVIKQNFEFIPGRWKTAAELTTFAR